MAQRFFARFFAVLFLATAATPLAAQTGNVTGRVRNALTGQVIVGAVVTINGRLGVTDSTGRYDVLNIPTSTELRADFAANFTTGTAALAVNFANLSTDAVFTLNSVATGFQNFTSPVNVQPNTTSTYDFTMIPIGNVAGDLRIVLTWGQNPSDLDSHLYTPVIGGNTNRIWFLNKGSTNQSPFAALDVDDVTSFGPETITIFQAFAGTYYYMVDHWTGSSTISESGARVDVFDESGLIQSFTPPLNCTQFGTDANWFVFSFDGASKVITPIQVLTFSESPPAPGSGCTGGSVIGGGGGGGGEEITLSYIWSFGDGTTSTAINPTHTYSLPGTYTVSLQINTSDGRSDSEVKVSYITVQPPATISVNDISVTEGAAGNINNANFTATLSGPSSSVISVVYSTADGTAVAPGDYTAASGVLNFPAGTTTQTITVPVLGDDTFESDETFSVVLSSASNATLSDAQGVATIVNDDVDRQLSINDVDIQEGDAAIVDAIFTVSLSITNNVPVTVNFTTVDSTALAANNDYIPTSGVVTFSPGSLSEIISVPVVGDFDFEADEVFLVNLSGESGASLSDSQGKGIIQNDDIERFVNINDISVLEGDTGQTLAVFDVTVSPSGQGTVKLDYETSDGAADASSGDYVAATGSLTFSPGETAKTITVTINSDYNFEPDEDFAVSLSNVIGATPQDTEGSCAILNDDTQKFLSIGNASVSEGDTGSVNADFTVSLTPVSPIQIDVSYLASDGTATTADNDYLPASGSLSFAPGETTKTISVTVNGDTNAEPNEVFFVNLLNPANATLDIGQGVGTIQGDEGVVPVTPIITSLSSTNGSIGASIEINGENFSDSLYGNIVHFGAVRAVVTDASESQLVVEVPAGATYSPVSVSVAGLSASSKDPFVVTFLSNRQIDGGSFDVRSDLDAGSISKGVVVGDFDDDGRPDLAASDFLNGELRVFRNAVAANAASASLFSAPTTFPGETGPTRLIAADLNGDGKLDIAAVNFNASSMSVYRNSSVPGTISFASAVSFPSPANPSDLAAGDFNKDGKPELVVSSLTDGRVTVYPNTSALGLLDASSFSGSFDLVAGNQPAGVRVGDIDGDGYVDIVTPNKFNGVGGNTLSLFRNTAAIGPVSSASFVGAGILNTPDGPFTVEIADLDRDGKLDLLTANANDTTVSAFRNLSSVGSFSFGPRQDFDSILAPRLLGLGDVDGDGLPELAVADEANDTVRVYRNISPLGGGGNLNFDDGVSFVTRESPFDAAFGDLDEDGKPELLVATLDGSLSIFRNQVRIQPNIVWNASPSLTYGQAVTADHYDVSVSPFVAGSFLFTPPVGAFPDAGAEKSLSVTFVPADFVSFVTVTTNRSTSVSPAPLTITPNPAAKVFGAPLPPLAATFATFVNGDTPADLDTPVSISTAANQFSDVGVYDITVSGASDPNYNITHGPAANLTITAATPVLIWNSPGQIFYSTPLNSVDHLNATADVPGTFIYTPPIDTLLPLGDNQTLSLTFTPDDTLNYRSATAMVTVDVVKADPVITWPNPADIFYGTALNSTDHLNATANVPGAAVPFVYAPAAGEVLNAGPAQILMTTFTPADTVHYNTVTAMTTINVLKADPSIDWESPADIVFGTPLNTTDHLNPIPSTPGSSPGSFIFQPETGTILNAGENQILSARFTPTDFANLNAVIVETTITVSRAAPIVTWNAPAPITFGTELGSEQLNAVADVSGVFTYTPLVGTKLPVGADQTLSVEFTPTDTVNYSSITMQVEIDVTPATPTIIWANPADIVHGAPLGGNQLNASSLTPGTFDYGEQSGEVLPAGTHQLSVTFTPDDAINYLPASPTVMINVLRADPVVFWVPPADIELGTPLGPDQLNATSSIEVPGTFAYSPDTGEVLQVGNGQLLTATFTPDDTDNFNTVDKQVAINVLKVLPVITWPSPDDIIVGEPLGPEQLNATSGPISGSFAYNPPAGTSLGIGQQTLSVLFTPDDTATFSAVTKVTTITVIKRDPSLEWPQPADITFGVALTGFQLNATADVTGIFVFDPPHGTRLSAGDDQELSVTFNPLDGANFNVVTKSVTIDVKQAPSVVTWNNPADITFGSALGPAQLNATANISGEFEYTTPNPLNAGNGQPLSVVFTPTDDLNYTTETKMVTFNVLKADPVLTWATPQDIFYGSPLGAGQLNAQHSIPGDIDYLLADDSPAPGAILDVGPTQTLRANFRPDDPQNFNDATATVEINVVKANPTITWANPADISFGAALNMNDHLNATVDAQGTLSFTPDVGTVLNAGAAQVLTAEFTPQDGDRYNSVSREVTINVNPATPEVTWPNPADIVFGARLDETQLNAEAPVPGQFFYTPPAGQLVAAGPAQTLSVMFVPDDAANYRNGSATALINVQKADPIVTWPDPSDIALGTPLGDSQLNAEANLPGEFIYTPAAGTTLNAGDNQPLSVLFMPTDQDNYSLASATASITVIRNSPQIDWPTPTPIPFGTPLGAAQQNARAENGVTGSFAYDPPPGAVLNAGLGQTITATFTPDDSVNYGVTVSSVTIDVVKADATIAWNSPAPISFGSPLSVIQLNASSPSSGTFAYNPPAGTVLDAGSSLPLQVTFTPVDTANFNTTTVSVPIDVLRANLIVRANDKAKRVNTENPPLTITFTGFVNGDTQASLATPASLVTTANLNSPIGDYDIFATGAAHPNYNVIFFKGQLRVLADLPPVVALTRPTPDASRPALSNIILEATASDDGTVTFVEFFNGAVKLGEDGAAPYVFTLENVPIGSHTFTAVATDDAGATTTSAPVIVNVTAAVTDVTVNSSGKIDLTIVGETGVTYLVQISEDLRTWTTIDTIVGDGTSQPVLDDTLAAAVSQRFYRIIEQP